MQKCMHLFHKKQILALIITSVFIDDIQENPKVTNIDPDHTLIFSEGPFLLKNKGCSE